MGNTLIVKKKQWGKFSGREHVSVVWTGKKMSPFWIRMNM